MPTTKTKRVYEVLADGPTPGPAGDHTHVNRFRKEGDAADFAKTATCRGRAAAVQTTDVPLKLYRRWADEGKLR